MIVTLVIAVAALVGWLLNSDSSPLYQYFLYHVAWPNRLRLLNLPAFLVAALLSGNVHAPDDWAMLVGFLVQWLPIGYLLARLVVRSERARA
jgi:hypothetical protein